MTLLTTPLSDALSSSSAKASATVFNDQRSRELLRRIERIAPSNANTLITGESGTGKELVARHIHRLSARAKHAFVAVNCAAFTESLVESELFGHEKGSFTGAMHARPGWFEAASGGTLFLDEVGDLPLNTQVKLLRVLQEREVVRIGSRTSIPVDVRIVAATNRNLAEAVVNGQFRSDLFYRLHVASIRIAPLRERRDDILALADFFLQQHARAHGSLPAELSEAARTKLLQHDWPGNIRELENAIQHALLFNDGGAIEACDLNLVELHIGADRSSLQVSPRPGERVEAAPVPSTAALEQALLALFEGAPDELYERIEETLFRAAYQYCHGNQLQTARLLGISRNIVRARLEKIGQLNPVATLATQRRGAHC